MHPFKLQLWREDLKWDDAVSENLIRKFVEYYDELQTLEDFNFARVYFSETKIKSSQLIGFCDASLKAYCAVIYLRTVD